MANQKKKDSKAGSKSGKASAKNYIAGFKRYFNKLKKLKAYAARNPNDKAARQWLAFMNTLLASDYRRGSEEIAKAQAKVFGHG